LRPGEDDVAFTKDANCHKCALLTSAGADRQLTGLSGKLGAWVNPMGDDAVPSVCQAIVAGRRCGMAVGEGSAFCPAHAGPLEDRPYRSRADLPRILLSSLASMASRATEGGREAEGGGAAGGRAAEGGATEQQNPELMWALFAVAMSFFDLYWRAEVFGVENIPTEGQALLAANHSGALPIDGALLKIAVLKEHGRNPWLLAGDLVFDVPGFGSFVRRMGNARADRAETLALLEAGDLVGVFPEGFKGIGKGWARRYQLQPFGRGGFVRMALQASAPIIPVAIVGAEEMYPMIANAGFVARALKLPYLPITPTFPWLGPLGALPFPSKCIVAFGEPVPTVDYGADRAEDEILVDKLKEEVRSRVQDLIHTSLRKRRNILW
jgi:1-acyl-sn-glycerol-3-phosphate acyltransferase